VTMRCATYRQVYVAGKFVKKGVALSSVVELMDQAMTGVEVALSAPAATVAVQPEELGDARARALAQGGTPDVPDAPRTALSGCCGEGLKIWRASRYLIWISLRMLRSASVAQ